MKASLVTRVSVLLTLLAACGKPAPKPYVWNIPDGLPAPTVRCGV